MRFGKRSSALLLAGIFLSAALIAGVGCDDTPPVPPKVEKARKLLDQLWGMGMNGQSLLMACCERTPGLGYCESKLDEALDTTSAQRKVDMLRRLSSWDDPGLTEHIRPLLDADSELVRVQAAKMLAAYGDAGGLDVLEAHVRSSPDAAVNPDVCGLAAALGSQICLAEAEKDLTAEDEEKSAAAAAALAEIGGAEAAKILRGSLDDLRGEKRAPAIEALGEISEDPGDVDRVLKYFGYRENVLAVIRALGALGGDQAEERLREVLETDDAVAKAEAAGALARMGVMDEAVAAAFDEAIGSDSSQIRYLAAKGLSRLDEQGPQAGELLARLLGDEDLRVVGAALDGLEVQATQAQMPALEQAWERLQDAGQDQGYQESMQLLVVISRIPGERSSAILEQALDNDDWGRTVQAALGILERHGGTAEGEQVA